VSRALDLAERAVRAAEGDEADASVHVERSGFARFAASAVHQPTLIRDESVTVRVVRDGRVGCATTNRTDDEGLAAVAGRAGEAAERSPVDPGFPGLAPPAPVPEVEGFDEETAAQTPEDQAEQAAAAIGAAEGIGLYGYYTSGETEIGVASTTGHAVTQATTDVSVLTLAAGDDVSGYAEATSWRASEVDPATEPARLPRRRPGRRTPARSSRRPSERCSSPTPSPSSSSTSASRP
jgi:predicted Zn-dependent protease